MPRYEYACAACGETVERQMDFADRDTPEPCDNLIAISNDEVVEVFTQPRNYLGRIERLVAVETAKGRIPVESRLCGGVLTRTEIPSSLHFEPRGGFKQAAILTNGQRIEGSFGTEWKKKRFRYD